MFLGISSCAICQVRSALGSLELCSCTDLTVELSTRSPSTLLLTQYTWPFSGSSSQNWLSFSIDIRITYKRSSPIGIQQSHLSQIWKCSCLTCWMFSLCMGTRYTVLRCFYNLLHCSNDTFLVCWLCDLGLFPNLKNPLVFSSSWLNYYEY